MKALLLLVFLVLHLAAFPHPAGAGGEAALQAEVQEGFERILDDWRDGRYEELFERTYGGRMTREAFARHFADLALKPNCCWDKLQDVRVTLHTASKATLRGTVGLESAAGSETRTKAFKFTKEEGVWRISQGELMGLAGGVKKGRRKRR